MNNELILLGQIFLDNNVFYKINLLPADFSDAKCRSLFNTMVHLSDKSMAIDEVAVHSVNVSLNVGWLAEVRDSTPSAANYAFYEQKIKDTANKKRLMNISRLITDNLAQGKTSAETKEAVEAELTDLAISAKGWEVKPITAVMMETTALIEERYQLKGELPGIPTGFSQLDSMTLGFRSRLLYIFGARPSRGKTALMLNMAMAGSKTHRIGIINTESANQEMGIRILSSETGINSQRLASGMMQKSDFPRIINSAGQLADRSVFFYDEPNASLSTVIAKCREMKRKDKVDVVFIDYLQNIYYNEKPTERENLGAISSKLKETARTLDIPIVSLAQLRRDEEGRRPTMSTLLGSGKMEQDADFIGLIYWQQTNKGDKDQAGNELPPEYQEWLLGEKNRDGITGDIKMKFNKELVKFMQVDND